MSVRLDNEVLRLEGDCRVEDAEVLLSLLQGDPGCAVYVSECRGLHSAVVQVLLAFRPELRGRCQDEFLQVWIISNMSGPSVRHGN